MNLTSVLRFSRAIVPGMKQAKRPADGDDIAQAIGFLVPPGTRHVNGQVLSVDGGA